MATATIYFDKRSRKNDGTFPLKITISHNGASTRISIGIDLLPDQWDDRHKKVINHPRKDALNNIIMQRLVDVRTFLLNARQSGDLVGKSATDIRHMVQHHLDGDDGTMTFAQWFDRFKWIHENQRTRELYDQTWRWIKKFEPNADTITFDAITKDWLDRFFVFMQSDTPSINARNIHLRNIRAVFNDAIDNNITSCYPFRRMHIKPEPTKKRSLTIDQLRTLWSWDVLPWQRRYLDIFKITFMLIGINTVDLLGLTDITPDDRIVYNRAKTHRLYNIKVEPETMQLINQYRGKRHLLSFGDTYTSCHAFVGKLDKGLKTIGKVIDAPNPAYTGHGCRKHKTIRRYEPLFPDLSIYYARHTWATIASDLDIPDATISAALGHGHGNPTTAIYIDFNAKKIDDANRKVLDWVLYGKR